MYKTVIYKRGVSFIYFCYASVPQPQYLNMFTYLENINVLSCNRNYPNNIMTLK
jgi:hypothetical protein